MKKVILAVTILAAASACTVRTERVVERPAPVPATAVVVADPPPGTVYVPR